MSLNSPTLQLCDNKEKTQDLHDSKNCKEQSGIFTNDDCMQQSTADHIEGNAANDADKSARYEGMIKKYRIYFLLFIYNHTLSLLSLLQAPWGLQFVVRNSESLL